MDNTQETALYQQDNKVEIILYQPDDSLNLEVRLNNETVWLNRQQMTVLFDRDIKTIGKHINNALNEELSGFPTVAKFATVQMEGTRKVEREIEYYNLDMILSVGYRVKSQRGIQFRIWSNRVLKDYLLKGFAFNQQIQRVETFAIETEKRVSETEKRLTKAENKIDFIVKTDIQKKEGILFARSHDRFLFIDDDVYHIGASLKDLGKKWFAFSKMGLDANMLLQHII